MSPVPYSQPFMFLPYSRELQHYSSLLMLEVWDHLTRLSPNPLVFSQLCQVHPALLLFSGTSLRARSLTLVQCPNSPPALQSLSHCHLCSHHSHQYPCVHLYEIKSSCQDQGNTGPQLGTGKLISSLHRLCCPNPWPMVTPKGLQPPHWDVLGTLVCLGCPLSVPWGC